MNYAEVCTEITATVEPAFAVSEIPLYFFRAKHAPPSTPTLWGRLTIQEFADRKRSINASVGNRLMASQGVVTIQCFGPPHDPTAPLNELFTKVKEALQDHRGTAIELTNIQSNVLGVVEGWDTMNVTADYSAYYRR